MKISLATSLRRALIILFYGYAVDVIVNIGQIFCSILAGFWAIFDLANTVEFSKQWFPKDPFKFSFSMKQTP